MKRSLKRRRKRGVARSLNQRTQDNSARRRDILRVARLEAEAERANAPKCGARTRSGGRCQKLPMTGRIRCERHGGKTGAGRFWHVVQLPADPVRRERKLRDIARRRERQAARVAAMTPAERERYERRSRAMRPGTPVERAQRRHDEATRREWSAAQCVPHIHAPETAAAIELLDRKIAQLEAEIAARRQSQQRSEGDE